MGELYEPFPKLPKNIRQIGERDNIVRVYVEDYVNTYLKRLMPKGGQDLRAGVLLGNLEEHGGVPYVFIDGALEKDGSGLVFVRRSREYVKPFKLLEAARAIFFWE